MDQHDDGKQNQTHKEAMDLIRRTFSVTTLSYEEAIAIYLRARGILPDRRGLLEESGTMSDPIPADWVPSPHVALSERSSK